MWPFFGKFPDKMLHYLSIRWKSHISENSWNSIKIWDFRPPGHPVREEFYPANFNSYFLVEKYIWCNLTTKQNFSNTTEGYIWGEHLPISTCFFSNSVTHMAPGQTSTPILRSSLNQQTIQPSPIMANGNHAPGHLTQAQPLPPPPQQQQTDQDPNLQNVSLASPPPVPTSSMRKAEFYWGAKNAPFHPDLYIVKIRKNFKVYLDKVCTHHQRSTVNLKYDMVHS